MVTSAYFFAFTCLSAGCIALHRVFTTPDVWQGFLWLLGACACLGGAVGFFRAARDA